MSRIAGNGEKSASGAKRVAEPPSSEGADAQSLLGNGQATRSSSLHDAAGPAPVSSSEMGSKWWRNTGQQSVSPYGTGFPTDLYSQDFQFGGPGGVDRRISMGDAEVSPVSSGATHMDDTPVRPGDQRDDTPTKQQDSTSDQQPAIPLLSSPLAGQNTRIFYEEDAEARSERDKFLQQLKGKR
ncbi:hypothetical protein EC988_006958 [Linderina pennispora]|nr:hypothetical protein EC988_006958 [Linderina pennispora]